MAQIHHSAACLRISGDELVPEEITRILRCTPTSAQRTGKVLRYRTGGERVVKCGNWRLNTARAEPEDLNGQIRWLLSQVESDPEVWKSLVEKFDVDIFCGLFMQGANHGMSLAPDVMRCWANEESIWTSISTVAPTMTRKRRARLDLSFS